MPRYPAEVPPFNWVFFVVIGLAVVFVGGSLLAELLRRKELRGAAGELGFKFAPDHHAVFGQLPSGLHLLNQGRRPRASNVLSGRIADLRVLIFDYAYTTGSGRNRHTKRQTVAAFEFSGDPFPEFEVRPERFYHKIGSLLGMKDIDLAEFPAFSRSYFLVGRDEQAVRRALTPALLERLLAGKNLHLEACGRWAIVYRSRRRIAPKKVAGFLEEAFTLVTLLSSGERSNTRTTSAS